MEEVRFGGHQRVRPNCHCFNVFLESFGLLECAPDSIEVGLFGCRGLRKFLVVSMLGLFLPLSRRDDVLYGCICSVAFGARRGAFRDFCVTSFLCVMASVYWS